jgi:hypothetical protein
MLSPLDGKGQDSSRSQLTAPEWVTAPWQAGRTLAVFFQNSALRCLGECPLRQTPGNLL